MDEKKLFLTADRELNSVIQQIKDDQWDMILPKKFRSWSAPDKDVTLREVVNYHAYDEAWIPDTLSGKTIEETGKDAHSGDLLGDSPGESFANITANSQQVVEEFTDLDRPVHLSYGEFPAREYLQHISVYRGFRVYDIAKVIGSDTKMSDDLVQMLWDLLKDHAEEWRAMGVFGPEVKVPENASLHDKLLGLAGRQL